MFKHSGKVLAVLATAGLLAGCSGGGGGGQAQPTADTSSIVKGGEAVIAMAGDIDFFDPILVNYTPARQVLYSICERLYEVQTDGSFAPQLATEMPEISEDGLEVVVPLREGVVFNDGTPFNAEAAKYNLDRAITEERSVRTNAKRVIKSVEVVDENTIKLNLNFKYSPIISELGDYIGLMASPTQLEAQGENFTAAPVCVGPFEYVSRAPGDNIIVSKSDKYYDKDQVNLDKITFKIVADGNARAANVESGDLDIAAVSEPVYTRLKSNPQYKAIPVPGVGYNGFSFNVGNVAGTSAPYGEADNIMAKNPKLREAFRLAIDLESYSKAVSNGLAPAGCSPIPQTSVYALDLDCWEQDIDQAKKLVQESGVPTPIALDFSIPNIPEYVKGAQVIQAMVKEAGFELNIVPGETLAVITNAQAGNFELVFMGWAGRYEPSGNMLFATGHPNNYAGYSGAEVDALLKEATETFDTEERVDIYRQAVERFAEDNAFIFIGESVTPYLSNKDFVVPEILGDGTMKVKTAGFTTAQ